MFLSITLTLPYLSGCAANSRNFTGLFFLMMMVKEAFRILIVGYDWMNGWIHLLRMWFVSPDV